MASRLSKRLSRKEIDEVANFSSDDESVDLQSSNILGSPSDSDFVVKSVTFSTSEDSDKENANLSEEEKVKRKKKHHLKFQERKAIICSIQRVGYRKSQRSVALTLTVPKRVLFEASGQELCCVKILGQYDHFWPSYGRLKYGLFLSIKRF